MSKKVVKKAVVPIKKASKPKEKAGPVKIGESLLLRKPAGFVADAVADAEPAPEVQQFLGPQVDYASHTKLLSTVNEATNSTLGYGQFNPKDLATLVWGGYVEIGQVLDDDGIVAARITDAGREYLAKVNGAQLAFSDVHEQRGYVQNEMRPDLTYNRLSGFLGGGIASHTEQLGHVLQTGLAAGEAALLRADQAASGYAVQPDASGNALGGFVQQPAATVKPSFSSYTIEDIPLPARTRGGQAGKYPFATLSVGQSFFVAGEHKLSASVSNANKRFKAEGRRFASAKVPGGVRVGRTA